MKTNPHDEWTGLDGFVDELRRLEAPVTSELTLSPDAVRERPARSAMRTRNAWQAGIALAGLAAAAVAYVLWPMSPISSDASHPADSSARAVSETASAPASTSNTAAAALGAMLSPWPAYVQAQTPGRGMAAPYPPLTTLDPSRLRAGQRRYLRLSASEYHASLPHETWTTLLDAVQYRGTPAWRLVRRVDRPMTTAQATEDTLWLRARDLRPLARRVHLAGVMSSTLTYTDSSMVEFVRITLPGSLTRRLPNAANEFTKRRSFRSNSPYVASSDMLRLLLRAAPLNKDWRASVQVETNRFASPSPNRSGYVNLRVAGVDTVQLFSGRFPCWRVVIETGGIPETWMVSQQTGETLTTDGPYDDNYRESQSFLMYGLEEAMRVPPVRRR